MCNGFLYYQQLTYYKYIYIFIYDVGIYIYIYIRYKGQDQLVTEETQHQDKIQHLEIYEILCTDFKRSYVSNTKNMKK